MEASDIFKCIADPQRLRILNLLEASGLCVCHLQELLEVPQVKMSKQLASMKRVGLITARREGTWMLYEIVEPLNGLVRANLEYLRTANCAECNQLQSDLVNCSKLILRLTQSNDDCPENVSRQIGCC